MIKIFLSENNSRVEEESILRGCRADVLVEIDGFYYIPFVPLCKMPVFYASLCARSMETSSMNACCARLMG